MRDRLAYLYYLPSKFNLADVLTKAVAVEMHDTFFEWCFGGSFHLTSPVQPISELINRGVISAVNFFHLSGSFDDM